MAFAHAPGWQAPSGNILKAVATGNGPRFGAYAVRFSGPDEKDLSGEYFTSETDFGPRYGDGAPVLIHHGNADCGRTRSLRERHFAGSESESRWKRFVCVHATRFGGSIARCDRRIDNKRGFSLEFGLQGRPR